MEIVPKYMFPTVLLFTAIRVMKSLLILRLEVENIY